MNEEGNTRLETMEKPIVLGIAAVGGSLDADSDEDRFYIKYKFRGLNYSSTFTCDKDIGLTDAEFEEKGVQGWFDKSQELRELRKAQEESDDE